MPRASVTIRRSQQEVWDYLTQPEHWAQWWGAKLKQVTPSWQQGATLVWENESTAEITDLRVYEQIELTTTFMTTIFWLRQQANDLTLVEIEDTPRGGATFNDGGVAHSNELASSLARLREAIEHGKLKKTTKLSFWDIVSRISIIIFGLYLLFFLAMFIGALIFSIFGWSTDGLALPIDGGVLALVLIVDIVVFFYAASKTSVGVAQRKQMNANLESRRRTQASASSLPVGSTSPALAAPPQSAAPDSVPNRIVIRNSYGHFDNSPLTIEAHPNLEQIFMSSDPPVVQQLSKDNEAHWAQAPAEERRMMAVIGYLQHPDPAIRKAVMPYTRDHNAMLVGRALTDRLGGDADPGVRKAAAGTIWARQREVNCKYVVAELLDEIRYGNERSMVGPTRAKSALQLLMESAPDANARVALQQLIDQ
jgi:uncharacterized protein YndB with AHSA1/START domain